MNRVDELLGRPVPVRPLALLRIAAGLLAVAHLRPYLAAAAGGRIYRDTFSEPYAAWYPELPRGLYHALLWAGAAAGLAMAAGVATRLTAAATFGVVAYNLGLSTTHFHNNAAYLVIVLAALAVVPCGRELSADAWWRRRRGRAATVTAAAATMPAWPLWLLRFEASVVYGGSGVSKLFDPDWFGGTVTWGRTTAVRRQMVEETPLPAWAVDLLTDRDFHTYAAKVIVATELLIAFGLWFRATRMAAVWLAVVFHVSIEASATVQVFSYLGISALVIWASPATRDRLLLIDPAVAGQRRLAAATRRLDWLARFRVEERPGGGPVRVVDRGGAVLEGRAATALVLSRLPATAFLALPAARWCRLRPGGRAR